MKTYFPRFLSFIGLFVFPMSFAYAQTFQSAFSIGGEVSYYDRSMVIDGDGNYVYTGGLSGTSDFDPSAGTSNLTSAGSVDIYVCKLSNTGALVWAYRIGGTGWDASSSCDVDTAGNIYVTGIFSGTVDFDPGAGTFTMNAATSLDVFILKLSPAGAFQWAKRIGSATDAEAWSIDSDQAGNTVTVGHFYGTLDINPNAGTQNVTSAGGEDIFILKLNPAGGTVWAKSIGDIGGDFLNTVRQNEAGEIFMAGYFSYTMDFDPGAGTYPMTAVSNADMFILKLTSAGIFSWAGQVPVGSLNNVKMELDDFNNVYINFTFGGTVDCDPTAGVFNLTKSTGSTEAIIKMSSSGNFRYAKCFMGTGTASSKGMDLDRLGSLYLSGFFYGTIDFNPGAGTNNLTDLGSEDGYVCKLDSTGNYVWVLRIGGAPSNAIHPYNVVLGNDFRIHFDGDFFGTQDFNTGTGTANLTANSNNHTFLTVYTQCIQPDIPVFSVSDNELCGADTVRLKITSGNLNSATDWKWYRNSCGGVLLGTGDSLDVVISATTNIYARGEGGCIVPASCSSPVNIVVHPLPVPDLTVADDSLCFGDDSEVMNVNISGGTLTGTGIIGNEFDPAVSGAGVFSIHYSITDIYGCTGEDSISMQVFLTPVVDFPSFGDSICSAELPIALTASPVGGDFSGSGISGAIFDPAQATAGMNVLYYTFTDSNNCYSDDSISIMVLSQLAINYDYIDTVCIDGSPVALDSNPVDGTFSGSGVSAGYFNPVSAGAGIHTIYFMANDTTGCYEMDSIHISVFDLPSVVFSVSTDSICTSSSPVGLTGIPAGGDFSGTAVLGGNFNPALSGQGVFVISYEVTDENGCINSDTDSVFVFESPSADISVSNDTVCQNGSMMALSAIPSGGDFSGNGVTGTFFDPLTVTAGNHIVYYEFQDAIGCVAFDSATIMVFGLPDVNIMIPQDTLCVDASPMTLNAVPSGGIFSGTGVDAGVFDPSISGPGNFAITYAYTDSNGCSVTEQTIVFIDPCLGIEDIDEDFVRLYPNPAREMLNVNTNIPGDYAISIIDVTGKQVMQSTVSQFHSSIDISMLSEGTYFVQVNNRVKKFTVVR